MYIKSIYNLLSWIILT